MRRAGAQVDEAQAELHRTTAHNLERGEEIASARVFIEDRVGYSGTSLLNTVQNAEQGLATILQASDGECVRAAAERVVRERDEFRVKLVAALQRDELARTRLRAWEHERDVCVAELRRALATAQGERDRAMERLRELDATLGSEGEPLQCIHAMRRMLGAAEGETLLAAVHRATQAVSHG